MLLLYKVTEVEVFIRTLILLEGYGAMQSIVAAAFINLKICISSKILKYVCSLPIVYTVKNTGKYLLWPTALTTRRVLFTFS